MSYPELAKWVTERGRRKKCQACHISYRTGSSGTALPKIEGQLNWHFKLNALMLNGGLVDYKIVPKMEDKEFSCTPDPTLCPGGKVTRSVAVGVKQCGGHLIILQPALLATAVSIYPDIINEGGDIAKVINATWGTVVGRGESTALTLIAGIATVFGPTFQVFKCSP